MAGKAKAKPKKAAEKPMKKGKGCKGGGKKGCCK